MNTSNETTKIAEDVFESFLKRTGLDLEVKKIASPNVLTGDLNSGFYDIYNGTTKQKIHSGCGENYAVIQFREAFDAIRQISGLKDTKLINGGTWNGGAEGWGQFDLGEFQVGKTKYGSPDMIANRLTMVTSHNGKMMFDLMATPFRFVCRNALPAIGTLEGIRRCEQTRSILRTRHTGKGKLEIENLSEVLQYVDGQMQETAELYNRMASIKIIDRAYITEVLARLLPVKDTTRSKNLVQKQITSIMSRFESADDGRIERDTSYNFFQSIQGSFQHDPIRRTVTHDKSVLIGTIAQKSAVAMQVVMEVTSSQHTSILADNDPIAQLLKNIEEGQE